MKNRAIALAGNAHRLRAALTVLTAKVEEIVNPGLLGDEPSAIPSANAILTILQEREALLSRGGCLGKSAAAAAARERAAVAAHGWVGRLVPRVALAPRAAEQRARAHLLPRRVLLPLRRRPLVDARVGMRRSVLRAQLGPDHRGVHRGRFHPIRAGAVGGEQHKKVLETNISISSPF